MVVVMKTDLTMLKGCVVIATIAMVGSKDLGSVHTKNSTQLVCAKTVISIIITVSEEKRHNHKSTNLPLPNHQNSPLVPPKKDRRTKQNNELN